MTLLQEVVLQRYLKPFDVMHFPPDKKKMNNESNKINVVIKMHVIKFFYFIAILGRYIHSLYTKKVLMTPINRMKRSV